MEFNRVIVVGASEGGVHALRALHAALASDLSAPVFAVLHIGAHDSDLAEILNRSGPLQACHPKDGDVVRSGVFYVAPPDRHMILAQGIVRLTKGPRENFARPSIDPLFRSAAEEYGADAIGVILTGGLNDGTAGLYEIGRRGGVTIVQDPNDTANPSMPRSALNHVSVDHCEPLAMIPQLLERILAERPTAPPINPSEGLEHIMTAEFTLDQPVAITCPDCGGALRQSRLGTLAQFRCHIGHIYTAEAMLAGQFRVMEQNIEATLRSVNERAELCREMGDLIGKNTNAQAHWISAMDDARAQAGRLRDILEHEWVRPAA